MSRSLAIRVVTCLTVFLSQLTGLVAQRPAGFMTGASDNPSLSGAEGDGNLRMVYVSNYPGRGYGLNTFHISYDTFLEPLHGGLGLAISSDVAGNLMNDTRTMFSWSYHLRASRDLYILAGMSSGLIYRGFNSSNLIFPDQIDPLNGAVLPGAETMLHPVSLFYDMGVGFTVIYHNTVISVDAAHLFRPDLSRSGIPGAELNRLYTLKTYTRLEAGRSNFSIVPYGEFSAEKGRYGGAAGGFVEYGPLGMGVLWIHAGYGGAVQSSLSVTSGRFSWLYGFTFSSASGENSLPFGVTHRVGIRAGLNIVEKRKTIKAINLPEL